jgi:Icc-related predicted phosphoesterase
MKFGVMSDLHLEFGALSQQLEHYKWPEADCLLLAGDICVAGYLAQNRNDPAARKHKGTVEKFFRTISDRYAYIFYVLGNHEHYHGDIIDSAIIIKQFIASLGLNKNNIFILENEHHFFLSKKILIVGSTLWTDFNNNDPASKEACYYGMNDYRLITDDNRGFSPDLSLTIHNNSKKYLESMIEEYKDWSIIVMTHQGPSYKSVHPRFAHSTKLNGAFVSNLESLMKDNVKMWVHGHVHNSFDYNVNNTRVLVNPRGYVNYELNPQFNSELTFEV